MKIIYISILDSTSSKADKYYGIGTEGFYTFGIGQFIAAEFIKRDYQAVFELWRSDTRINKEMSAVYGEVVCRVFPSRKLRKPFSQLSIPMLCALIKAAKSKDVVIHFMLTHNIMYHLYALCLGKRRCFATHLGDPNPLWIYERSRKLSYLLAYLSEKHLLLRSYKMIYTICRAEESYYKRWQVPVNFGIVYGVCREDKFYIKDRNECRQKLGLPIDKKIILQVGRAVEYRGFDWILRLMDHYASDPDILFVMVGINEWDPYYSEIKKRDCLVYGYVLQTDLPDFYNAADLFIFLITGEKVLTFGGTGYVPIEALYCGTPVVASSLHHIREFGIEEVSKIPTREEDLITMVELLLTNPPDRVECRTKAKEIFDWSRVLESYWKDYNELH
jgi:glycosyltransferase involved in cell wall biosynthesis